MTTFEGNFIAKEVKLSKDEVIQEIKSILASCYKLVEQIKKADTGMPTSK